MSMIAEEIAGEGGCVCYVFHLPERHDFSGSEFTMALTPSRIFILLGSTLVLSVLGILLMIMGVHGPRIMLILGAILLLPNVILTRLGVPVGIPLISSTSVISILVFFGLQAAYFYGVFQLIYFVVQRSRRRSLPN